MANKRIQAKLFILNELTNGPLPYTRLMLRAKGKHIPERTLRRAAYSLGVRRQCTGFGARKKSMWSLPPGALEAYKAVYRLRSEQISQAYRFERAAKTEPEKAYWFKVRFALRKVEV